MSAFIAPLHKRFIDLCAEHSESAVSNMEISPVVFSTIVVLAIAIVYPVDIYVFDSTYDTWWIRLVSAGSGLLPLLAFTLNCSKKVVSVCLVGAGALVL